MSSLFAFLHHLAAFTLVAALALEFVLVRDEITFKTARRLQVADIVFGASAGVLLVVGLLRLHFFEKGPLYYLHSAPFWVKFSLFVLVGLASIYPTIQFLSWRKQTRLGQAPVVDPSKLARIRSLLHFELAGVVVILLCAALMAKGIGQIG